MSLEERIYSVLIVSAAENLNVSLQGLLPESRFSPVTFARSVGAARRALLERSFDFVIINAPLPDDDGARLAIDVCTKSSSAALLLVKSELYHEISDKTAEHGVFLLPKPVSRSLVLQALDWMAAVRERLRKLEKKTVSIEEKMQEIRLVNRAKWLLIDKCGMTEAEAHRTIEKQAMDRCVTRREIAEAIITSYPYKMPLN